MIPAQLVGSLHILGFFEPSQHMTNTVAKHPDRTGTSTVDFRLVQEIREVFLQGFHWLSGDLLTVANISVEACFR